MHGERLKLGVERSQATVAKDRRRSVQPPSQNWRTLLTTHASHLASRDGFTVPTATFRVVFVLVVRSHDRRRIIRVTVSAHPTAEWTAQPLREAWPDDEPPAFPIRDRDDIYGATVRRTLRSLDVQEVSTAPRSPWPNPFAERVIGSLRREWLDHMIIWTECALRHHLRRYISDDHVWRPHLSLDKDAPTSRPRHPPSAGRIVQIPDVGGLRPHDERRAA